MKIDSYQRFNNEFQKSDPQNEAPHTNIFPTLDSDQTTYLLNFTEVYSNKRIKSKNIAEESRASLCNNRKSSSGFRLETKELNFPIIASRSKESTIWDIDGNKYVDLSMGYGANLFGHQPPFIQNALKEQLEKGYQIGPEAEYAHSCAQLISEVSKQDKVLFANSGTEAIMTSMRIARAFRKKDKIVLFQNSYHGHFDSTLVTYNPNNVLNSKPMCIGIPESLVADIIVLPYAEDNSIVEIEKFKDQIAAVLVEPVQNSRPDLHPKEFLKKLRKITHENGISLIFDEVLVGFRIAYGGAQEWFDIYADLVVYAKIVGGGLPIGVIAGEKTHMDIIDGGMWNYNDSSAPFSPTTFTAGTFCKHPLAMAACYSTLIYLKHNRKKIYNDLNNRSSKLFDILNNIFAYYSVPIKVCSFGSFFRFAQDDNLSFFSQPLELDIFFYHLIEKGIYVWECKTCFITTAHSDDDINFIIQAVNDSIRDMKRVGFWSTEHNLPKYKNFVF